MKDEPIFKIIKGQIPHKRRRGPKSKLMATMKALKVGECFDYPFEGEFKNAGSTCYMAAARSGIRVSIPSVIKSPLRVWRVE